MNETDPKFVWRRFQAEQKQRTGTGEESRIAIAGSMTVEPLEPYLGACLVNKKFKPRITVGPFNQLRQICHDPEGVLGTDNLGAIVLLWRIEDLFPDMLARCLHDSEAVSDLVRELKSFAGSLAHLRKSFKGTLIVS